MRIQYCRMASVSVRLSDPNGLAQALYRTSYGERELEARFGRYIRGKRKGQLRGWVVWERCTVGGWHREKQCVMRPGQESHASLVEDAYPY